MESEKRILVTGGAGFIGGNFVLRQVLKGDTCVINLDALTYAGNLERLSAVDDNPNYYFVLGSIGDRNMAEYVLHRYKPDAVVNFAVVSHVDRSIDSPEKFVQTNILGSYQLLEASRQYWNQLPADEKKVSVFYKFRRMKCMDRWVKPENLPKRRHTNRIRPIPRLKHPPII